MKSRLSTRNRSPVKTGSPHLVSVNYRSINELRLDERNARLHSPAQLRQIEESIRSFGFVVPVLLDGDDELIAGHGRLLAARQLGLRTIPTISLAHLTPAQARALQIADNRLTENATWDEHLLALNLQDLSALELDFSLEVTGFTTGEIDLRIQSLDGADAAAPDPADQAPAPNAIAVSAVGDLWQLGDHRVLCADALTSESYAILLGDSKADLVFSDPPYNVKVDGHVGGKGTIHHPEFVMASGELSDGEFQQFLNSVIQYLSRNSKRGAVCFLFMDWRHFFELLAAGRSVSMALLNCCVWVKHQAGMGSFYRSQHELVAVFRNGGTGHTNNVQLGRFGRNRSNVWEYPGIQVERRSEEGDLLAMHPTVKPIRLVADAILDASKRGERVLDPFLGSGTTLMAAHRVGRLCYGMEFDPRYVDVAIRRWQADTGECARHATTGERFEDREKATMAGTPPPKPGKRTGRRVAS